MLNILEASFLPEPYIPYFPCNLAFDAHERFSRDPDAIRRLIDMGRPMLAVQAATDELCRIEDLKPVLIELGNHADLDVIRAASWHLAYFYRYLHPQGERRGYVEKISHLLDIDLFLLFENKNEPPYAVVLYPKQPQQALEQSVAQRWVDLIFPETVRGPIRQNLLRQPDGCQWYQHGYIEYRSLDNQMEALQFENVIIKYRSQLEWNPKAFL